MENEPERCLIFILFYFYAFEWKLAVLKKKDYSEVGVVARVAKFMAEDYPTKSAIKNGLISSIMKCRLQTRTVFSAYFFLNRHVAIGPLMITMYTFRKNPKIFQKNIPKIPTYVVPFGTFLMA